VEEDWHRSIDERSKRENDDYALTVRPGEESPPRLVEEEDELNDKEIEELEGEPIYECPDCGSVTIRGKWAMDGARTLTDAAQKLRDYAHELEHMRSSGLELSAPVEDDYGIVRPGGAPPAGVLDADEDGV